MGSDVDASPGAVSHRLAHGFDGQPIHPIVQGIVGMTLDLMKTYLMHLCKLKKFFPEILVLYRLLGRRFPPAFYPAREPSVVERPGEVGTVGVNSNTAARFQRRKSFNSRRKLHAVVGGVGAGAGNFLFPRSMYQKRSPSTGTGIPAARAIRIYDNFVHAARLVAA